MTVQEALRRASSAVAAVDNAVELVGVLPPSAERQQQLAQLTEILAQLQREARAWTERLT